MSTKKKNNKKSFSLFSFFRDKKRKGTEGLSQLFTHLNLNPDRYQYTSRPK